MIRFLNRVNVERSADRIGLIMLAILLMAGSLTLAGDRMANEPIIPPSPSDGRLTDAEQASPAIDKLGQDRPLSSLVASIKPIQGDLPPNRAAPRLVAAGTIFDSLGDSRPWMVSQYEWDAPATRYLPLYFEEPNLERMGYTYRCCLSCDGCEPAPWYDDYVQPFLSAIHFYGQVAIVPIRLFYEPPAEPVYTLGVDRPGSPLCYREHFLPFGLKRICYQSDFLSGLDFGLR